MPPTTNSDSEDDLDYVPPADGKPHHTLVVAPKCYAEYPHTDHDSDSSNDKDQVEPIAAIGPPAMDPAEQKK